MNILSFTFFRRPNSVASVNSCTHRKEGHSETIPMVFYYIFYDLIDAIVRLIVQATICLFYGVLDHSALAVL